MTCEVIAARRADPQSSDSEIHRVSRQPMLTFRLFLVAAWLGLMGYTAIVIQNHGPDLVTVFFGDIAAIGWPGQFNLDFTIMLALSAISVA